MSSVSPSVCKEFEKEVQLVIDSLRVSSKLEQKGVQKANKRSFKTLILSVPQQRDRSFSALLNFIYKNTYMSGMTDTIEYRLLSVY